MAFPESPKPDYPIDEVVANPEVLISVHRDGSEQRRLKGGGEKESFVLRYGGSMPMTETQRNDFLAHWSEQSGTFSSWTWTHPETGDEYTVRYAEAPRYTLAAFNAWSMEIKLKVVPA